MKKNTETPKPHGFFGEINIYCPPKIKLRVGLPKNESVFSNINRDLSFFQGGPPFSGVHV